MLLKSADLITVGDELYNYLLHNGPILPEKVQKIFAQLVGAVTYVHNMSCVHRDLKLENILLDKNENVKLCDFGFTREYEGKMSYLQTFCGTVCYSPPEMLRGEKYAGEKVDVWSLGVILYTLLAGELPFDDDNEVVTKRRILTEEPIYSDRIPPDAKALIAQLLSKRPLLRPTLADILANPFLAGHAPQQRVILNLPRPPPFTTEIEKNTLQRMRSAGVNIDQVIENVLAQRCDALAGWWALSIEKEERKEIRRERKRKERDAEAKNLRRLSAASTRLERNAPLPTDVAEEYRSPSFYGRRGRREKRNSSSPARKLTHKSFCEVVTEVAVAAQAGHQELPRLPEGAALESPISPTPPPPIEKDSVRSASPFRTKPIPPPKARPRTSRGSALQAMSLLKQNVPAPSNRPSERRSRRHQHPFINHLASIKQWFLESAKRARSPASKSDSSTLKPPTEKSPTNSRPSPEIPSFQYSGSPALAETASSPHLTPYHRVSNPRHRLSLSPSPLTPHSSLRRSSAGLRGRKSTSSSVSSIRSIHHVHTHSKASSTSSTSNSVRSSAVQPARRPSRSPHSSIKVLPSTPTTSAFPSNVRLVRSSFRNESAFSSMPTSPGLVFARRKKTPFRGPQLNLSTSNGIGAGAGAGTGSGRTFSGATGGTRRDSSIGASRSGSVAGRQSGEIIEEEDEDEIEEVDVFSPVPAEAEEIILESEFVDKKKKKTTMMWAR